LVTRELFCRIIERCPVKNSGWLAIERLRMPEDLRPQGSTSTVQPEFCAAARCAELLQFAGGLPWVAWLAVARESFCRSFAPQG